MSCNVSSCNRGLQPICLLTAQFQPNVITCPQITTQAIESPLCDLLPTITSIADFFVNLPFLMLFVVSLPARFLYCMAYEFLVNADNVLDFLIYYIIYPGIDFITLPFIYFVLGFNNGVLDQFSLPTQPYGFLNGCFFSSIEQTIYTVLGDLFYIIGFGIGFFSSLFVKFINLLLDVVCSLVYLTICFGVGFCLQFCIPVINFCTPKFGVCASTCIQPFGFLQNFICNFINCSCAIGTCPQVNLYLILKLGCSPSGCQQSGIIPPECPQYNLNPVQQTSGTYTQPQITEPSQQVSFFTTNEIFSLLFSIPKAIANVLQSLISQFNKAQQQTQTTESYPSEIYVSETVIQSSELYVFSELDYCQQCLYENTNCDLCVDALNNLKQSELYFPCCNYACLISNACYLCSEYQSEQVYENACTVCNSLLSACTASQSYSNLPCYSEFVNLVKECITTNDSEICAYAESEYNYCKVLKAYSLCPPTITSESETYSETSESYAY